MSRPLDRFFHPTAPRRRRSRREPLASSPRRLRVLLIGVAIKGGGLAWVLRALGIFVALLVTLPAASHLLARAALRERDRGHD